MWIPVWNKCKNRRTGFSTLFFTAYAYIRIVLEIGTLNFNSWQQVEEDEQKDYVLDVQDASYGTKRCCCFNNITHLSVAQQKPSPWAVISHFYTLKTATSSACVPLPTQQMTLLVTHLCWNGRKGEPNNCSVILASCPSSLRSAFHWILFLISYASREQPVCTTSLHCTLAVQAWQHLLEPLLPCPLLSL